MLFITPTKIKKDAEAVLQLTQFINRVQKASEKKWLEGEPFKIDDHLCEEEKLEGYEALIEEGILEYGNLGSKYDKPHIYKIKEGLDLTVVDIGEKPWRKTLRELKTKKDKEEGYTIEELTTEILKKIKLNSADILKAVEPFKTIKSLAYGEMLLRFLNNNHYASRDKTGRLHSNLTNLKKSFRSLITPDNFISIDCSNSQPLLLVASGYNNAEFKKLSEEGKIYGQLMDLTGLERGVVKQELLRLLFRRVEFHEGIKPNEKILYKGIIKKFPDLIPYLEEEKKYGHNKLALKLQQLEADIFVDIIYSDFLKEHPDEQVFCLHDSIICHSGFEGEVETKIKKAFEENFHLRVEVKSEKLENIEHEKPVEVEKIKCILDFDKNDMGLADQVFDRHGESIKTTTAGQFFYYDNQRWVEKPHQKFYYGLLRECKEARDKFAEKLYKNNFYLLNKESAYKNTCSMTGRMDSAIKVLTTLTDCKPDIFDSQPHILGLKNGLYDLDEKVFRDYTPSDFITKNMNIEYDPTATAPVFEGFIKEILPGNDEREFLMKYFGYCLTGDTTEQNFFILKGEGGNGKSVLIGILLYIFGELGDDLDIKTFGHMPPGAVRSDLMRLKGRRLITTGEPKENFVWDTGLLNAITGDKFITARNMRANDMKFRATNKLVVALNKLPRSYGDTRAFWRRVKVIDFPATYLKPDEQDYDKAVAKGEPGYDNIKTIRKADLGLLAQLEAEAQGIFNILLDYYYKYKKEGLLAPASVSFNVAEYKEENKPSYLLFFEECCEVVTAKIPGFFNANNSMKPTDLYRWYKCFCEECGYKKTGRNKFCANMDSIDGVEKSEKKINGYNLYNLSVSTVAVNEYGLLYNKLVEPPKP